ncbi:DUF2798 domain-containing protein [Pararhodobacter sp. CCB-MM2]|uniref:DUF2798 domain-containing protein n=1 Tax=Pararhodobacter sp. CCB-MM2 TaxID=1786003 RepID=UPI00082A7BF0|nr:DUF2798 domain-containing protein [Pararhodobacter sp. CCB-MM2]MCA2014112.1 DUF2798 domain-containing protein [Cereibacter sphaeroides]
MQPKPILLTAQLIISGLMALMMSGIMHLLHVGVHPGMVQAWLMTFLTAWPIAFVLSLGVGPLAFRLAYALAGKRP